MASLGDFGYRPSADVGWWRQLDGGERGYVIETGRVVLSGSAKDLIDDSAVRWASLGM